VERKIANFLRENGAIDSDGLSAAFEIPIHHLIPHLQLHWIDPESLSSVTADLSLSPELLSNVIPESNSDTSPESPSNVIAESNSSPESLSNVTTEFRLFPSNTAGINRFIILLYPGHSVSVAATGDLTTSMVTSEHPIRGISSVNSLYPDDDAVTRH
jgi:hypothetical protein